MIISNYDNSNLAVEVGEGAVGALLLDVAVAVAHHHPPVRPLLLHIHHDTNKMLV